MSEKRIKVKIDKEGNFNIETVKGFVNGECHNTIEAIVGGIDANVTDSRQKDDYHGDNDQLLNLK